MLADCTRITTSKNDIRKFITGRMTMTRKWANLDSFVLESLTSGTTTNTNEEFLFDPNEYDYESLRDSIVRKQLCSEIGHVSPLSMDTVVLGHLIDLNGLQSPPEFSESLRGKSSVDNEVFEPVGNTFLKVCQRLKQKLAESKSRIRRATLFTPQKEGVSVRRQERLVKRLSLESAAVGNGRLGDITGGPTYITGSAGSSNSIITIIHYSTERTSSISSLPQSSKETESGTSGSSSEDSLLTSFRSSTAATARSTNIFNLLEKN